MYNNKHFYLITTFNHQKYIEKTIDSVKNQYLSEIDFLNTASIFIIDDCSKDNTVETITKLSNKYKNIKIHPNEKNKGISFNRNFLLDWYLTFQSKNDYVIFVDGDDLLPKDSLKHKHEFLLNNPDVKCVGGQIEVFYDDETSNHHLDTFSTDQEINHIANIFECHFYISNALFVGDLFQNEQIRFSNLKISEDWDFFSKHNFKKAHIDKPTLLYRRHNNNLTNAGSVEENVFKIRNNIRNLQLNKLDIHLSPPENLLFDYIGYLSFKLNNNFEYQHNINMHWFSLISKNSNFKNNFESDIKSIENIFNKISTSNKIYKVYNQEKLDNFLSFILKYAKFEFNQTLLIKN